MYTGRSCWLCGRNGTAEPLDKHHIFGGAYRKKSEKYGLTVYLCHGSCHIFGEKAVHSCRETMDELHRYGQKMAMERMVVATGRLQTRTWKDKHDQTRKETELNATNLYFGDTKKLEQVADIYSQGGNPYEEVTEDDGELPF